MDIRHLGRKRKSYHSYYSNSSHYSSSPSYHKKKHQYNKSENSYRSYSSDSYRNYYV